MADKKKTKVFAWIVAFLLTLVAGDKVGAVVLINQGAEYAVDKITEKVSSASDKDATSEE